MYKNVELRKLPVGSLVTIAAILETNNDWKKVMSLIPRNPLSEEHVPKYNLEHIKQIEDYARSTNKKCAEVLFEEWGTSGRIRPTLSTLKDVIQKAEVYRAADELAAMLEESPPPRPHDGPAAVIDTNITLLMEMSSDYKMNGTTAQMKSANNSANPQSMGNKTTKQMKSATDLIEFSDPSSNGSLNLPDFSVLGIKSEKQIEAEKEGYQTSLPNIDFSSNNSGIDTEILTDEKLIHFEYRDLERITRRFADRLMYTPDQQGPGKLSGKVGSGGFGDVFVGFHGQYGHLAIKKARTHATFDRKPEIALKVFNSEVKFLSQFRHKNIVPIIGYSRDGPALCIVCEFIDGGSLEHKIAAKILTEKQRLNILLGTAEGLKYLHGTETPAEKDKSQAYKLIDSNQSSKKHNFVHGDVKTANILLTRDCEPKLCDFGLAKQYDNTTIESAPMGTLAYMAPEGFGGTITQKIDIYSFGIVLLEVLTGLKPLVYLHNGEKMNIKHYVDESCPNNELTHLLDPFIDKWTKGKELYALARRCLERDRKSRPTSREICDVLYQICGIEKPETPPDAPVGHLI